jgi:hypothetical protein
MVAKLRADFFHGVEMLGRFPDPTSHRQPKEPGYPLLQRIHRRFPKTHPEQCYRQRKLPPDSRRFRLGDRKQHCRTRFHLVLRKLRYLLHRESAERVQRLFSIRPEHQTQYFCLLFQSVRARFGDLAILGTGATRNSDSPNKLAVHDDRNTAINRDSASEPQ